MKTIVILSHVGFDNSPYCNYVHWHAKELAKQGYKVVVLAIIHWIPVLSKFQKYKKEFMKKINSNKQIQLIDGVEVIYIKSLSVSNFLYDSKINLNGILAYKSIAKTFDKIYKNNEVVLIDAHTFKVEGYVASKLKEKYNITTTVTLHGTSFFRNTKTENGINSVKNILNKIDYSICVSDMVKRIAEFCGVTNTRVIYNGITHYKLPETKKDKYQIISVGALIPRKNHDITIKVIEKLVKEYPQIKLKIVGFGAEKENLEKIVTNSNLEKYVEFKNQIENNQVIELMNESNIFLLPSVREGFGIVYAEAMNAKCITIGTKEEGIDGFIKNGENGFLVSIDVDKIVALIKDIYEEKYNLEEIRNKAYEASSNLTWTNNAKKYIELLETKGEDKNEAY